MSDERFLITGSSGCIGAWTVRLLRDERVPAVAFDLSESRTRLELLLSAEELEDVTFWHGDIADPDGVAAAVRNEQITHIVHLAALQVPFCKADPVAGARVNVVGTVNVFEAARHQRVAGLSYASSIAVFGPATMYPGSVARDDSPLAPGTLYGAYKQANEGTARVYAADWGVASVGLRPCIVYGPGRDQGLTSDPTKAMLAAAAGVPFHMAFGGSSTYQHARDVAAAFIAAARARPDGAAVHNLGGPVASMGDVVAAIEAAAPEVAGAITFDDVALPFPEHYDGSGLDALVGGVGYSSVPEGVADAVASFRSLLERGLISPPQ